MGDSISANLFMLGYALQRGAVPLTKESLMKAIELNGVAVASNQLALQWGRMAAEDMAAVEQFVAPEQRVVVELPESLVTSVRKRMKFLEEYQNLAYANDYKTFVDKVRDAEKSADRGDAISKAVARNLFKLMAYKDEYEVARLYTGATFKRQLEETFEGDYSVSFNLAPPIFSKKDASGYLVKRRYGSWMMMAFKGLSHLRFLRGTRLDVFGYSEERRTERQLITDYQASISTALPTLGLGDEGAKLLMALALLPERIRGFGHVKLANLQKAEEEKKALLLRLEALVQKNRATGGHRELPAGLAA